MSEVSELMQHYKEVRLRLRYPPNAVPDTGINLKRAREPIALPLPSPEPVLSLAPPTPSWSSAFSKYQPFVAPTGLTFSSTLEISAAEFGLTSQELHSKSRKHAICRPRQVAIYVAGKQGRWSATWVARRLDLDHSTVLHAQHKIACLIETNTDLKNRILSIEAAIEARYPSATTNLNEQDLAQGAEGNVPFSAVPEVDSAG